MPAQIHEFNGERIFECEADGPRLRRDRDATDILTEVWANKARWIAIPVQRLGDEFFDLKTRIAGEVLQKFSGYGVRVAIVGDISSYVEASNSLRDFVRESNRGNQFWFVESLDELQRRLAG